MVWDITLKLIRTSININLTIKVLRWPILSGSSWTSCYTMYWYLIWFYRCSHNFSLWSYLCIASAQNVKDIEALPFNLWLQEVNTRILVYAIYMPSLWQKAVFGQIAKQFQLMDWCCPSVCPSFIGSSTFRLTFGFKFWNLLCNLVIPSLIVSC